MFSIADQCDHDVRHGLPIVARATPEKLDMLGESGVQDNAQPANFEGDADDRSKESIISLGGEDAQRLQRRPEEDTRDGSKESIISLGGDAQRLQRRPEEDTRDGSENPIIKLGDRDAEQRRRPPKSRIQSRFGFDVIGRFLRSNYRKLFFKDIRKIVEETALQRPSMIDIHVLESIFDALGEDRAQDEFLGAIPGFFDSELVHVSKEDLSDEFRNKFRRALNEFLDRTFSLNSIAESARGGRLVICLNAADAALSSEDVFQILSNILSRRWPELLQSAETGNALRRWSEGIDDRFTPHVRRIVAQIVVGVRERDERWISLVKTEYGVPEHVLRDYIGHGDSVLLSILLHMTREAFRTGSWQPWTLSSLSVFNIRDTFPELQRAFCALWNDIVRDAWSEVGPTSNPVRILRDLRHAYIALHQGTPAALTAFSASTPHFDPVLRQPQSYLFCTVASHRPRLTIYTPMTGSFDATQLNQPSVASPIGPIHSSPTESDHTHDSSIAPREGEEANIIVTTEPLVTHGLHI